MLTLSTVVLVGIHSQAHQRALCENRLLNPVARLTPDKYSGGNKERSRPDNQREEHRLSSTENIKGAKVSAAVLIFIWFNVLRPRQAHSWRWELEDQRGRNDSNTLFYRLLQSPKLSMKVVFFLLRSYCCYLSSTSFVGGWQKWFFSAQVQASSHCVAYKEQVRKKQSL